MVLLSAAAYVSGFFLGFLFGIPKRNVEKESAYNLSTNLVDISDWLTKIIIGLGLIEIKKIPATLQSIGIYVQTKTSTQGSVAIFTASCLVYFSIFGLYYGYNYMRLFLSGQFKEADDNLLMNQKKLSETKEELKNFDLSPNKVNEEAKEKVNAYNELLKSTKTEEDYTFDDWYIKGVDAYNRQDYNSSISNMNKAIEKDRKNKRVADAYLYVGLSFYYLKSYENAILAYNKIINEYTNYPFLYLAYVNRGLCYYQLSMLDKALLDYDFAINLNPAYQNAWAAKGDAHMDNGQYEEAIIAYSKAITLSPNDAAALFNRGVCYAHQNIKDKALEDLRKAVQLNPEYKGLVSKNHILIELLTPDEFKSLTT
jgi:tetratricopeptide (TPR) repeat protein